jgi:hypothetical protein
MRLEKKIIPLRECRGGSETRPCENNFEYSDGFSGDQKGLVYGIQRPDSALPRSARAWRIVWQEE